jgi:hypothetical protein
MKSISKQNRITKIAFERGYRVSACGNKVSGIKCSELRLSTQNKRGKFYRSFNIRVEGMSTRVYVHKLQAFQKFSETMFAEGTVVRHMNDKSLDNSYENIEIGSQLDNMMDKISNASFSDVPF